MDDYSRIGALVDEFNHFMKNSVLDFRIPVPNTNAITAERAAIFEDAMINASNIAMDVEEHLRQLLILKGHLQGQWTEIESSALAKPSYGKFTSDKAKLAPAIEQNRDLFQTLSHISTSVESGMRSVYRLESLQKAASRALGVNSQ